MSLPPQTKLVKPRTKQGKRVLEQRAPKLTDSVKFARRNDEVKPFEPGGETPLERHGEKGNCSLFAVGSHTKKRPDNLVLGRLFDFRLYDMVEFGVHNYRSIQAFGGAADSQLGNKPCFIFVGEAFENDPALKQVRLLLLDFFRGRQVPTINLKGLDRVVFVTYLPDTKRVLFRQYNVKYKKSGTRVPRVELAEMGPSMDLEVRRSRQAAPEVEKEATKQPKLTKKKEKNVGADELDGKVGRIYMPKQDVDNIALRKMKGLKRERREAAGAAAATTKKQRVDAAEEDGGE
ncbi:hypothetical protein N2152v2_009451 [Parachlorella kessleri]